MDAAHHSDQMSQQAQTLGLAMRDLTPMLTSGIKDNRNNKCAALLLECIE